MSDARHMVVKNDPPDRPRTLEISFVSLCLVVVGCAWAYIRLRALGTPIILHFSDFSGIDRIGTGADLLLYGGLGAVIVLMNGALAHTLSFRERFWSMVLSGATLLMAVLIFILFAVIISVN
jgi:hypothetical protein